MAPPRITTVNHAQITIPPGAEAAATARHFYITVLGLTEIAKPEALRANGGFWLLAGSFPVHIGVEDGIDRARSKAHLAYEVDDLAAWREHLTGRGIETTDNTPIPGFVRCMARDPFGNRIEFIQPLP